MMAGQINICNLSSSRKHTHSFKLLQRKVKNKKKFHKDEVNTAGEPVLTMTTVYDRGWDEGQWDVKSSSSLYAHPGRPVYFGETLFSNSQE